MHDPKFIARHLATTLVEGAWELSELTARGAAFFGRRWRWFPALTKRLVRAFPSAVSPSQSQVQGFLLSDNGFLNACDQLSLKVCIDVESSQPARMVPVAGRPATWAVPEITSACELADFLGTTIKELSWLADRYDQQSMVPVGRLRHYAYRWQAKRVSGSARLIEMPKWRLKMVQRRILQEILEKIPVHGQAHGFCRGRSTRSFAAPHVGQAVVIRSDLRDFFPSILRSRIRNLFRTAGYPFEVASTLAALCTNSVPDDVWHTFPRYGTVHDRLRHEGMYQRPHLPQGAPTSPALANLAAYRLDCRLSGLARAFGARYTRYADDLLFSGGAALPRKSGHLLAVVGAIAEDEGFRLNVRKNRVMGASMRQAAAGLTVNRHLNIDRRELDRLKAILYNCAAAGPDGQNHAQVPDFQSHLRGRVAYVELVNPVRGKRLRELYEGIVWS